MNEENIERNCIYVCDIYKIQRGYKVNVEDNTINITILATISKKIHLYRKILKKF